MSFALPGCIALLPCSVLAVDLVSKGATWRYLADGSDQGTAWRTVAFQDAGWATGAAELGYGDGDETTVVNSPSGDHHITSYFRIHFNVADPGNIPGLTLEILRDDGAVVYLNGSEIYRTNMPLGVVSHTTLASYAVYGSEVPGAGEAKFHSNPVLPMWLVSGDNVLAVEVHQENAASLDLSFDLALRTSSPAGPPRVIRGPYLQMGTSSSMIVRWRTDVSTDSRLAYGPATGSLNTTISQLSPTTEHVVLVTSLAADTRYYYEIGTQAHTLAGNDSDHYFRTSPAAGTPRSTRIWVMGDSGRCAFRRETCVDVRAVKRQYLKWVSTHGGKRADLLLLLGDNAYGSGRDGEYTRALFEVFGNVLRNHVLWPVPGNHDFGTSDSPSQAGPYYQAFSLPTAGEAGGLASGTEAYYSFDFANIHLVALDSYDTPRTSPLNPESNICPGSSGGGGSMYNWLCSDLAATNQDWVITFWHHPPYSKGSHDSDTESIQIEMRERFTPVIEARGVDLNLTGHSHSYERSVLIDGHYGDSRSYSAVIHAKDAGDGDPAGDGAYQKPMLGPDPNRGTVYLVVGSSSKNSGGLTQHPIMAYLENYEGSLVIDIDRHQLDAYFINRDGAENDHFRILKGPEPVCGNGSLEIGEECDDGNISAGDCCSAACAFEMSVSSCAAGDD